jgi:ribosomal-protein-alanine N-acetyltransferase
MTGTAAALRFAMMRAQDVEAVVAVENDAYPFPWTRGNFLDSLASRYEAWTLREADARLAGYFLLMHAVDETHLLNITVRPDLHGRGYGRMLLDKVIQLALDANMHSVLLEVRPSNEHALAVYRHCGFQPIGVRKQYYPAAGTSREDAIVMRLMLDSHGD